MTGQLDISTSLVGDNTGSGLPEAQVGTAAPGGTSNLVGDPNGHGVIDPNSDRWPTTADRLGPARCWPAARPSTRARIPRVFPTIARRGLPSHLGNQTDMGAYESPDITPPAATLDPNSVVVTASAATFTVTYTDPDDNVLRSTIDGNDILVAVPDGSNQYASLVSVTPDADGSPLVATYQVNASGGAWSVANTGNFTVTMQAGQVSDTTTTSWSADAWGPSMSKRGFPTSCHLPESACRRYSRTRRLKQHLSCTWANALRIGDKWLGKGTHLTVDLQIEQTTFYLHPGSATPIGAYIMHHDYDLGILHG